MSDLKVRNVKQSVWQFGRNKRSCVRFTQRNGESMKRRIEELMNGIYEYKTPDLLFSCDEIRAVVKPGEKFFGSFTIKNKEQKRIRGFLYSSDARVACEPREFSGIDRSCLLMWILRE